MNIHHYGFLTKNISKSIKEFESLGYEVCSDLTNDIIRGIDIIFLSSNENHLIELVSPNSDESIVDNIMKTKANGVYHICYEVENIEDKILEMQNNNFVLIDSPKPAPALNNKNVAFMMSRFAGMIELLEK